MTTRHADQGVKRDPSQIGCGTSHENDILYECSLWVQQCHLHHPPFITIFMGWIPTIKKWVVYGIATYPHGCLWNISTFDKNWGVTIPIPSFLGVKKTPSSVHIKIVGTFVELPQSWFSLPVMVPWVSHLTSLVGNTRAIWRFPEIGVPPNHQFNGTFHEINHPFWGTPICGNLHMNMKLWNV